MDNTEAHKWQDITLELSAIRSELKMMEMIKADELTLEDCMQAQEINDDKMDPKFDICHEHTIDYKLANKLVRLPGELGLGEVATVFANVLQLEAGILQGQPLSSTIYSFSYLYSRQIYQDSYLFTALLESINCLGSYLYELIKQAGSVKEDDVTIPGFSFSRLSKTHDEVAELILQAEKKFEAEWKKNEDKASFNFVLAVLRMRRSMHMLAKSLGVSFDPKNQKKIQTDLQGTRKKIAVVEELKYPDQKELLAGVFLKDLHKTIKAHFGPRQLKLISLQSALKEFRNVLEQLELFIPTPNKISELKNRAEMLQSKPYNGWSKSYIKYNIFTKEHYIFSTVKTEEALIDDINDWVHLNEATKNHEKFTNLIKVGAPVISETLYRLLGNSMRWHWECSKIYEDYNVLIHMANQVDSYVVTGAQKQMYVSSWFYYYGLELMVKQLLVGFENNLFQLSQLKYIFYVVENILGISHRNGQIHLRKLDKTIFQNFNEGNFNKKMKKKMNENEKCMFSNIIFKKGLYLYFRAIFKLLCVLHARKIIPNKFEDTEEIRVKNRFRVFKHVLFTKIIDYAEYRKTVDEVCKKENEYLQESLEELKEVKNVYKLFTTQLEDGQTYFRQREDAELVTKLSVKASLVVMTLKMGVGNKKIGVDLSGRYPQFIIQ